MFGIDLDSFNALGLHGMMALIILVQSFVALKVISLVKEHVVPLATNHFKHVEDAFERMNDQSAAFIDETRLRTAAVRAQTEVITTQTTVIEAQGVLLRTLLKDIETRSKE